jgi:probable HAF family extracellular repeat protein
MNLIPTPKIFRLAALIAFTLPSTVVAAGHTLFRITDLGALPGADSSYAFGLNDFGQVTGQSGLSPFFWSPQTGIVDLGIPAGYNAAGAGPINNSGQIAVRGSLFVNGMFESRAFRWANGVYQDLGTLGGSTSTPVGIDEAGRVAGNSSTSNGKYHAFRSTAGGSLVDIDGLGGNASEANAINASGHIVGQAYTSAQQYHIFLWTGSGPMQNLGSFGTPSTQATAYDISDNGIIVGLSGSVNAVNGIGAFILQNGVATPLSSPLFPHVRAQFVNNAGQVVGSYSNGEYNPPFVWDAVNGGADLNSLLEPLTGAGWTLHSADNLNNVGQIVGVGHHNGQVRAFLLTPVPEPTAAALLTCCIAIVVVGRRLVHLRCYCVASVAGSELSRLDSAFCPSSFSAPLSAAM